MNAIFFICFSISTVLILFKNPNLLLSGMLDGADKALKLSISMLVIYSVWLGVLEIMDKSGLKNKLSNLLKPLLKHVFKDLSPKAGEFTAMNIACNMLGLGGIATPLAIKANETFELEKNIFNQCMLFVISATSIQLLPTTVISLRNSFGSVAPSDIILPSLLSTIVSTACGIILTFIFVRKKND